MERVLPCRRSRPLELKLPPIKTAHDVLASVNVVVDAAATGRISGEEGDMLLRMVDAARKGLETIELRAEIDALERRLELVGG